MNKDQLIGPHQNMSKMSQQNRKRLTRTMQRTQTQSVLMKIADM